MAAAAGDESKAAADVAVQGAGAGAGAGSGSSDAGLDVMIAEALAGIKGRVAAAAKAAGRTDPVRARACTVLPCCMCAVVARLARLARRLLAQAVEPCLFNVGWCLRLARLTVFACAWRGGCSLAGAPHRGVKAEVQ